MLHHLNKSPFSSLSSLSQIRNLAVIGSGQMGTGIAIVANRRGGFPVTILDSRENSLKSSRSFINAHFDREISKKTMTSQDKDLYMSRFRFTQKLEDLRGFEVAIEVLPIEIQWY